MSDAGRASLVSDPVGIVLAGGTSRRMGYDKGLLQRHDGTTLLERAVTALRAAGVATLAVSVATSERALAMQRAVPALAGVRAIVDEVPACGPLGGLHAALRAFPGHHVVLVACDMPYLDAAALRLLWSQAAGADIVVPRWDGRDQPLHALYGPACLRVAARLLSAGQLAMRDLLAAPGLCVRVLDEGMLDRHGIAATTFANVNTPADAAALLSDRGRA